MSKVNLYSMNVAVLGNMNNNNFAMVRYLRDLGINAKLFLFQEQKHFLPTADSFNEDFKTYVEQLDWYSKGIWKISKEEIRKKLKGFDFVIGTDFAPAFLYKAGLELDIMFPHGGDIYLRQYYRPRFLFPIKPHVGNYFQAYWQRKGITNCKAICMPYYESFEKHFSKTTYSKNRKFINCPMIYLPQYEKEEFETFKQKSSFYNKIRKVKESCDILMISQSRHEYDENSPHYKGTDKLINGYARYLKNSRKKSKLLLFEYGSEVEKSKKLIKTLNIQEYIVWLPLLQRKEIIVLIDLCDFVIGIIGNESYITYGSIVEAASREKFVVHTLDVAKYKDYYEIIYPFVNVKTTEDIFNFFMDFEKNPTKYASYGEESKKWVMEMVIKRPLDFILSQINKKKKLLN